MKKWADGKDKIQLKKKVVNNGDTKKGESESKN